MNESYDLDARVHIAVLGRAWDETRCRVCGWPLSDDEKDGCARDAGNRRPAPVPRADAIPHYSTSNVLAWLVVEHLHAEWQGLDEGFYWHFTDGAARGWIVEIWHNHHDGVALLAYATGPFAEAVCRAALIFRGNL